MTVRATFADAVASAITRVGGKRPWHSTVEGGNGKVLAQTDGEFINIAEWYEFAEAYEFEQSQEKEVVTALAIGFAAGVVVGVLISK